MKVILVGVFGAFFTGFVVMVAMNDQTFRAIGAGGAFLAGTALFVVAIWDTAVSVIRTWKNRRVVSVGTLSQIPGGSIEVLGGSVFGQFSMTNTTDHSVRASRCRITLVNNDCRYRDPRTKQVVDIEIKPFFVLQHGDVEIKLDPCSCPDGWLDGDRLTVNFYITSGSALGWLSVESDAEWAIQRKS